MGLGSRVSGLWSGVESGVGSGASCCLLFNYVCHGCHENYLQCLQHPTHRQSASPPGCVVNFNSTWVSKSSMAISLTSSPSCSQLPVQSSLPPQGFLPPPSRLFGETAWQFYVFCLHSRMPHKRNYLQFIFTWTRAAEMGTGKWEPGNGSQAMAFAFLVCFSAIQNVFITGC